MSMTDSKAMIEARKIWGVTAHIAEERTWADSVWTKQIGYLLGQEFIVVGSGLNTWDAAFASLPVDKGISGVHKGTIPLYIQAAVGTVAPFVEEVEAFVDGVSIGPRLTIEKTAPWWVSMNWDTTKVPDGMHELEAIDGMPVASRWTRLKVAQ
jgi:hypothetical protein